MNNKKGVIFNVRKYDKKNNKYVTYGVIGMDTLRGVFYVINYDYTNSYISELNITDCQYCDIDNDVTTKTKVEG